MGAQTLALFVNVHCGCEGARHGGDGWSDMVEGFHLRCMFQCSWSARWSEPFNYINML